MNISYNNSTHKYIFLLLATFTKKIKMLYVIVLLLIIFFKIGSITQVYADDGYRFKITNTFPTNGATNVPINLNAQITGQSCSGENNYIICTVLIGLGISSSNPTTGIGYPIIDESSINSNTIVISSPDDSEIYAVYRGKQECYGCSEFYHSFTISFVNSEYKEVLLKPNSTYTITLKSGESGLKAYYESSFQKYYAYLEQDYSWSFTTGNDTVPPKISVVNLKTTNSTATISWTTNEQAENEILYGLTKDFEKNISFKEFNLRNTVTLSNLEQGKKYYYKILSKDIFGNENYFDGDFTTLEINNVQVSSIDSNSAVISWSTNRNTDSYVEYGISTNYGLIEGNSLPSMNHSIRLVNLSPGTNYNFRIKATENNEISYSQNFSFKTKERQSSEHFISIYKFSHPTNTQIPNPTNSIATSDKITQSEPKKEFSTSKNSDSIFVSISPSRTTNFKKKPSFNPTGVVAGISSNKNNNIKILIVFLGIGVLMLLVLTYISKNNRLKQLLRQISYFFKRFSK